MANLATKHRPQRFEDLCGQETTRVLLQGILRQGKSGKVSIPESFIFEGSFGSGKTTSARLFSRALLCEKEIDNPCNVCESCLLHIKDQNPAYREFDAASVGNKEDIERLKEELLFRRTNRLILVFDEAHTFSLAAWNSILKTLEEPPPNTTFIFASTEVQKIIKTVRSRSFELSFRDISVDAIKNRLKGICDLEHLPFEENALEKIAQLSKGHMRDAVMLVDKVRFLGSITLESLKQVVQFDTEVSVLQIILGIADGDYECVRQELLKVFSRSSVRDLIKDFFDVLSRLVIAKYTKVYKFYGKEADLAKLILQRFETKIEKLVREAIILRKAMEVSEESFNLGCFYFCSLFGSAEVMKITPIQAIRARSLKQDPLQILQGMGLDIKEV